MDNKNMISFHHDDKKAEARVHGNGFIQVELADGGKMHIWTKDCPRQKEPTLIHNHTSGFNSTILHGMLRNEEYSLAEAEYAMDGIQIYTMYDVIGRNKKDTGLRPTFERRYIETTRKFYFAQGTTYNFPGTADLFHKTVPETDLVVTRVFRESDDDRNAVVLVPEGKTPDNVFDRYEHSEYAMETYLKVKKLLRIK